MNSYSQQLRNGASEVSEYLREHATEAGIEPYWYGRLAEEMHLAAEIEDDSAAEQTIRGIARMVVDSFPLSEDFAPSFGAALLAVQHADRRRRRERKTR